MIWVGSFKSLQTVLAKHRFTGGPLDVHTWVRSEIALISPLVDWLMNLSFKGLRPAKIYDSVDRGSRNCLF
jgi:hypothetical protein